MGGTPWTGFPIHTSVCLSSSLLICSFFLCAASCLASFFFSSVSDSLSQLLYFSSYLTSFLDLFIHCDFLLQMRTDEFFFIRLVLNQLYTLSTPLLLKWINWPFSSFSSNFVSILSSLRLYLFTLPLLRSPFLQSTLEFHDSNIGKIIKIYWACPPFPFKKKKKKKKKKK